MRVHSQEAIENATVEQSNDTDAVLMLPTRIALGFWLTMPEIRLGPNPQALGRSGMGGSLGFADPDAKVGCGCAMNQMLIPTADEMAHPRRAPMIAALYAAL